MTRPQPPTVEPGKATPYKITAELRSCMAEAESALEARRKIDPKLAESQAALDAARATVASVRAALKEAAERYMGAAAAGEITRDECYRRIRAESEGSSKAEIDLRVYEIMHQLNEEEAKKIDTRVSGLKAKFAEQCNRFVVAHRPTVLAELMRASAPLADALTEIIALHDHVARDRSFSVYDVRVPGIHPAQSIISQGFYWDGEKNAHLRDRLGKSASPTAAELKPVLALSHQVGRYKPYDPKKPAPGRRPRLDKAGASA